MKSDDEVKKEADKIKMPPDLHASKTNVDDYTIHQALEDLTKMRDYHADQAKSINGIILKIRSKLN